MVTHPTQAGWPLGIDNLQPRNALPEGALRGAINADIYDGGKVRRRRGATQVVAAVAPHSLWSHESLAEGYYVQGGAMFAGNMSAAPRVVRAGLLAPAAPVAYEVVNGEVFWSNGTDSGRISAGVDRAWGLETPASQPALAVGVGALPAGTYQVAVTYRTMSGEESGSRLPQAITLPATGGIQLTALPLPADPNVSHIVVYVTPTNGDVLYKVATIPVAAADYNITTPPQLTIALRTALLSPLPPGTILAHYKGQLFSANGNALFYSEPMRYGLCNTNTNFYLYPAPVTMVMAIPEGLYVVADRTYFLRAPGTPEVTQEVVLSAGAVPGTGVQFPNNTHCAWFSPRGQVIASGGKAEIITEKHYAPGIMLRGASLLREQEGLRQIITVAQRDVLSNPLQNTGA